MATKTGVRLGRGVVYFQSAEQTPQVANDSVRFSFVSPPFTNRPDGKSLDKEEYLAFVERILAENFRVLLPGGVLVLLNTDLRDHARYNGGDRSFDGSVWHKHHDIRLRAERVGLRCFEHKIWVKSEKQNRYRYNFSHILFYSKPGGKLQRSYGAKHAPGFAPDVWSLKDSMQRRSSDGFLFRDAIHPEIVRRCVDEFSLPNDLVLSSCAGSGTVCAVSEMMQRRWVGYEINPDLEQLISESVLGPRPNILEQVLCKT